MTEHKGQTDEVTKIELPSSIQQVYWNQSRAPAGAEVVLEIFTHYVGNGSEVSIELSDESGKKHGKIKQSIICDQCKAAIKIPENAKDILYASVELSKHGLKQKSNPLLLIPKVEITNVKWDKKEARRGDILKLAADVKGVLDGNEAKIEIWEYDQDGAHDLITKFPATVKNGKIEMEWEYEYYEDTDDIPTEEETEKGYNPPEYFFKVVVNGVEEKSELFEFKDWIDFELIGMKGLPLKDVKFKIIFADGTSKSGQTDEEGRIMMKDLCPGRFTIEFY